MGGNTIEDKSVMYSVHILTRLLILFMDLYHTVYVFNYFYCYLYFSIILLSLFIERIIKKSSSFLYQLVFTTLQETLRFSLF